MRTLGATNGDIDFTVVDGIEAIKQQIVQRLLFWRGEWFLDTEDGIPYLPSILGRRGNLNLMRAIITAHIRAVEGVTGFRNVEVEYRASDRRAIYRADVDTIYGEISELEAETPALPLAA